MVHPPGGPLNPLYLVRGNLGNWIYRQIDDFVPPRCGSRLTTWGVRSGLWCVECRWLDRAKTNPRQYLLHGPRLAQGRDDEDEVQVTGPSLRW